TSTRLGLAGAVDFSLGGAVEVSLDRLEDAEREGLEPCHAALLKIVDFLSDRGAEIAHLICCESGGVYPRGCEGEPDGKKAGDSHGCYETSSFVHWNLLSMVRQQLMAPGGRRL
ncbi:MAG: hypothetical protein WBD07_09445, partial [Vicinamibacterales bacterium]